MSILVFLVTYLAIYCGIGAILFVALAVELIADRKKRCELCGASWAEIFWTVLGAFGALLFIWPLAIWLLAQDKGDAPVAGLSAWVVTVVMVLVLLCSGCRSLYVTYDRYAADGKTKVSTLSVHSRGVLYKTLAPKVTFNADGSASMEGYSSDAGQAAVSGAIEAACKGAVKGVTGK